MPALLMVKKELQREMAIKVRHDLSEVVYGSPEEAKEDDIICMVDWNWASL